MIVHYHIEGTSIENGVKTYKLVEVRAERAIKTWIKYAKWFEEEVKRKKDDDPTISERIARGRVYNEMMRYLTSEEKEQKRVRGNLRKQTIRALETLKLYRKQIKSKRDEQKANEVKEMIQENRIELLELC